MLALLIALADVVVPPPGAHPDDPLAAEYQWIPPRPVGAAAGQVRFVGLSGVGYFREVHAAAQGTIELIAMPNFGLRATLEGSVPLGLSDSQLFSARVGPSLHLLPYRRVDLGSYLEAGVSTVDIFRERRAAMFTVTPGGTFDVALDASWAIRIEAQVQLGTVDFSGNAQLIAVPMLLFGFGPVL